MTWLQWLFVSNCLKGSVLGVISIVIQGWLPVKERIDIKIFLLGRALSVGLEVSFASLNCPAVPRCHTSTQEHSTNACTSFHPFGTVDSLGYGFA